MTLTRDLATDVLAPAARPTRRSEGVRGRLDAAIRRHRLSPPDTGLLTELVYGVVRHQLSLDTILARFSKPPLSRLDGRVLAALRMGVYQILWLDRVPDPSAVDETVAAIKCRSNRRTVGFANGVLRSVCRDVRDKAAAEVDRGDRCRSVYVRDGRFAVFGSDLLPDPDQHPAEWISRAYSVPAWLVRRWLERLGRGEAEQMCAACDRTPHLFVRANLLRTTRAELVDALRGQGLEGREGSRPECVDLGSAAPISRLGPLLQQGLCSVQDDSAMQVAPQVDPQPGDRILEACAAPGGKTTHLAELAQDRAFVVALDRSAEGLAKARSNRERLGLAGVALVCGDALLLPVKGFFDKVLLDVPCSNTGVLARRVDARWRLREGDIARLAGLQAKLLRAASACVRPGGRLVYSTCSTEPEENREVIEQFIHDTPAFQLLGEQEFLPCRVRGDGGYAASMTRL